MSRCGTAYRTCKLLLLKTDLLPHTNPTCLLEDSFNIQSVMHQRAISEMSPSHEHSWQKKKKKHQLPDPFRSPHTQLRRCSHLTLATCFLLSAERLCCPDSTCLKGGNGTHSDDLGKATPRWYGKPYTTWNLPKKIRIV